LWKTVSRDGKATKQPFQPTGTPAKSNDPATWCSFDGAHNCFVEKPIYDGLGFVFARGGNLCGIDLDGCRNPETGEIAKWAKDIILRINTYAEVSPSGSGAKLFVQGKSPFDGGKKLVLAGEQSYGGRTAGLEIYDYGRYFAVTGIRLRGKKEPQSREGMLKWLASEYWPKQTAEPASSDFYSEPAVVERARKYLAKIPPSISGQGGHNTAYHAACVLIVNFGLSESDARQLLKEWNQSCQPPWNDKELEHKLQDAAKVTTGKNCLRNVRPEKWPTIAAPVFKQPTPTVIGPSVITLADATMNYIDALRRGEHRLIELGIPDLDRAIGGGVEKGEMILLAGLPGHGKSAVAVQIAHHWAHHQMPVAIVSEEMSNKLLSKRTIQTASDIPVEEWRGSINQVREDLYEFLQRSKDVFIVENCGRTSVAVQQIEKLVAEKGVQCVVVDYAQLLRGDGGTRYEEVTNTSILLRDVTNRLGVITIALCQLNRGLEGRDKFIPKNSDIKDSGQLGQDADVIIFCAWPHQIRADADPHEYLFFVTKNRSREIARHMVKCRFEPSRQLVLSWTQHRDWSEPEAHSEFSQFSGD